MLQKERFRHGLCDQWSADFGTDEMILWLGGKTLGSPHPALQDIRRGRLICPGLIRRAGGFDRFLFICVPAVGLHAGHRAGIDQAGLEGSQVRSPLQLNQILVPERIGRGEV